jgi:hypothetical protein
MTVPLHPILSLKAALRTRLLADPDLAALIGGGVHDAPPRGLDPPYLALGDARLTENGASLAEGAIIDCELVGVTRERGSAGALELAAAVAAALADPLPTLSAHRLVALDLRQVETRHDPASGLTRAILRLRAFTEPT